MTYSTLSAITGQEFLGRFEQVHEVSEFAVAQVQVGINTCFYTHDAMVTACLISLPATLNSLFTTQAFEQSRRTSTTVHSDVSALPNSLNAKWLCLKACECNIVF